MKRNIEKIISVLIVLVFVATLFSGCKKSDEDEWISEVVYETVSGDSNTQNQAGDKTDATSGNNSGSKNSSGKNSSGKNTNLKNPLDADLGGKTIKVYSNIDFTSVNAKESKAAAAQAEMVQKLQKELNCKVAVTKYDTEALYQQALLNVASGTYFADVVMPPIYTTVGYISSGFAYNLADIPTIDLSKDYMNMAKGIEAFKLGSGNWAIGEPLTNSRIGNQLYVNKRILKEVTGNENYVYNLINEKQWNLTNFRNLAKKAIKDLDGVSGMSEKDQYGIVQIDIGTSAYSAVFESMGADMIKNTNGKISYNMEDPTITSAANLAYEIYVKDGSCIKLSDDYAVDNFRSGHALFLGGSPLNKLSKISDMDDEFGVVPYPTKDGGTKYSIPANWNFNTIIIPSNLNSKQASDAGAFVQAYCYLANNVVDATYNEYNSRYLCDEQSRKNLDICYNAVRITPASVIGNSSLQDIYNGTYKVCYSHYHGENISTLIQSTANAAKSGVNELNAKFK